MFIQFKISSGVYGGRKVESSEPFFVPFLTITLRVNKVIYKTYHVHIGISSVLYGGQKVESSEPFFCTQYHF